jgi:hypothetical protein
MIMYAGLSGKKVAPLTNHRLEFVKTQLAGFERIQPAAVDAAQQQQQQQPAAPQDAGDQGSIYIYLNIWWPMPLFLDIYFIYRYNMEVDGEQIYIQ